MNYVAEGVNHCGGRVRRRTQSISVTYAQDSRATTSMEHRSEAKRRPFGGGRQRTTNSHLPEAGSTAYSEPSRLVTSSTPEGVHASELGLKDSNKWILFNSAADGGRLGGT
jgi:hypothetical protein